jgi:ATP-dependent helicase/nuclease subunit A
MQPARPSNLTLQQHRAVSCREVSIVLSSGAGCGKTHVLTQRYLSHLENDGAEVGQIVAITFTERAARQMRSRIRHAVLDHVRAAPTDEEAERWARHLRGLETAQISTIHAFCGTILRQHAVEAGLDPQFDVLEDVLSVNLETEALTACLQRLLTAETNAGEDLRQLVLLYGWRPVLEALQGLLHAWDAAAWQRWLATPPELAAVAWQEHGHHELLPKYVAYLLVASPKIAGCLDLLRHKPPLAGSKMEENVRALHEELAALPRATDLAAAVERITTAAQVGRHGAKAWPVEDDYQRVKKALKDLREASVWKELAKFATAPADLPEAVQVGHRFLRVANEAMHAFGDLKRQHGVVDFQDLLLLARDLLRDQPDVRARLQERYRFLLIDELQDTDPVQMQLVEHLCGGGLTAGKLFAVGDHSQSIYRFRGANVHLFRDLRQQVPHEGRLGLTVNFRSQPAVLDFVNALFAARLTDYEPLLPHHRQVNPGPCVEFLWSPRSPKESVSAARRQEADWIARRIAAMVQGEALIDDRSQEPPALRPVQRGDVVILFRAMSNVHLYEAALREHGLDYYLVGGRAFFAQQEIYDILNLLRALENPQDGVSLAGTLRSPFCCLSDEALFVLSRPRGGLWVGLHDDEAWRRLPHDQQAAALRARRHLGAWRQLKDRLPIAGLLGRIFADSGYDASTQFEHLGDRKLANLWKLVDLARTFDRSGLFGLAEFIQRLGDLVRNQPREEQAATQPESADVVRLMTIHQAKGLEFPVVFVADLAAGGRDGHKPVAIWSPRMGCVARPPADDDPPPFPDLGWRWWQAAEAVEDWHEDLRTLYVACTRAEDYLVLSAALERPCTPASAWMLTLAERFDLQAGTCRVEGITEEHRPRVRICDNLDAFAPSGPVPTAWPKGSALPSPPLGEVTSRAVAHVPVRLARKRIFTVAELEPYLNLTANELAAMEIRPADVAAQFDAEDGSDRSDCPRPRDVLRPSPHDSADRRDVILRGVLEQWDFRQVDGWQSLLAQGGQPQEGWREALAALLGRFAASSLRQQLADARTCHREVEFLASWPDDDADSFALRGLIDCLWQDQTGVWHLLDYITDRQQSHKSDPSWERRKSGLVLAAWAVQRQLAAWPRSVSLCCLETGLVRSWSGRQLQQRKVLAAARDALRLLRRQVVVDR